MLTLYVLIQCSVLAAAERCSSRLRGREERGQASAEYALVLLGAAAVALLVTGWASKTNRIGRLLDGVMDRLLSQVR